jgi:CO/xanthine dehydrogenase FAD-binding subunit
VKPAAFGYVRPDSLDEACAVLAEHGGDAQVLAGGQSLMPLLNLRLARPALLVDIARLPELAGVGCDQGTITVGATTRQRDLEIDATLEAVPVLRQAVAHMGSIATRNIGTVGGAVAFADPVAELPLALVTLGGAVTAASGRGTRQISGRDLYSGHYETTLQPDEILTGVSFPVPAPGTGTAFAEVTVRHWGDPTLVVAMAAVTVADGRCATVELGLGGVAPTPRLVSAAAGDVLTGEAPTADVIAAVADAVITDLDPPSDVHGSSAYRRRLARHLAARVLTEAFASVSQEVRV